MNRWTLLLGALLTFGCATPPDSFVRVMEPTWTSVELRDGLGFDEAWEEVTDVLAREFELEMIAKDGGYMRTAWIYTWWKSGVVTEDYRVRAIVKFSPGREVVDVKTEAQWSEREGWVLGTDTRMHQAMMTDIMGVVGRTTR
jgi:hypothetical protein